MKKQDILSIIKILKNTYPDAKCSLDFTNPFELLVSVILSAQCTDERVNKTTPLIFAKYHTPEDFAKADLSILEDLIHPCGFYKTKSKNIQNMAKLLLENYNGQVPQTMEELMQLPGVGRKTANVMMLEAFQKPQGIAVDTHCKRICNKLGLSHEKEPEKIEQDLLKLIPSFYYKDMNHLLIWHGRNICTARNPKCDKCPLNYFCEDYQHR